MTHARHGLWVGAAIVMTVAAVGCAMADSATAKLSGDDDKSKKPGSEEDGANRGAGAAPGAAPSQVGPTATGVILVHAAKFPSFRLCFENTMDLAPQPDGAVMPDANVVGVEVGSVVRVNPLKAPGKIYVIREVPLRGKTGSCRKLFDDGLQPNLDYQVTDPVETPLGELAVHLLAISGCGGRAFLPSKTVEADCGPDWKSDVGNLKGTVLVLPPTRRPSTGLPVQLFHLAPSVEAAGKLEVTFGPLATEGPLPQSVAAGTELLRESEAKTLDIDQDKDATFAQYGFRIAVRANGATTATKLVDQTLANVQELSAPSDVPTSYYRAGSNYALLLLGDPAAPKTLDGTPTGPPDPTFQRRGVHLLAIPVIDPTTLDAGAPEPQPGTLADGGK